MNESSDPPAVPSAETNINSSFQLAYEGPAVSDGSMDVRDLAPALHALGELIDRSNELLNGDNSKVTLRVLAEFRKSSFDINFLLDQTLRDTAAVILPAMGICSAPQILDLALGSYSKAKGVLSGVAKIYKALKGERPAEMRPGSQANTTIIVLGNNNTVVADSGSARLYSDDRVRDALTRAAGPLRREGIKKLEVKRSDIVVESLEPPDLAEEPTGAALVGAAEEPHNAPRDIWVRVVKPNFDGGRWTFHDGSARFGAEVEDKSFQARVDRREQGFYAEILSLSGCAAFNTLIGTV